MNPAEIPTTPVSELPADDVVLLDVREPDEWAAGHAPGAVHIPLGDLPASTDRIAELPDDRPVYVICRTGGRSAQAAAWLNAAGLVDAVNVSGGMKSWQTEGRPLECADPDAHPEVL